MRILLPVLLLSGVVALMPTHHAKADTFCVGGNQNYLDGSGGWDPCMYEFTVNLDQSSYSPNGTITATGQVVDDVCDNQVVNGYEVSSAELDGQANYSSEYHVLFQGNVAPLSHDQAMNTSTCNNLDSCYGSPSYGSAQFTAPSSAGQYSLHMTGTGYYLDAPNGTQQSSSNSVDLPFSVNVTGNQPPTGHVDSLTCTNFTGWAFDPDSSSTAIPVVMTISSGSGSTVLTPGDGNSVTDASGNTWTLGSDQCPYENGVQNASGCGSSELGVDSSGVIWAQDASSGSWYSWDGSNWNGPGTFTPASSAPTTLTPGDGNSVTDASGNTWTLGSDQCPYENGVQNASGCGSSELGVDSSGVIWAQDASSGSWYSWDGSNWNGPGTFTPASSGSSSTSYTYNSTVLRTDVNNTYGITGTHGYSVTMPTSIDDNMPHTIHIYAQDTQGGPSTDLTGGGTQLTCGTSNATGSISGNNCTLNGGSCSFFVNWSAANTNSNLVDVQETAPDGSTVDLGGQPASTTQQFTANQAGTYVFDLYDYNTNYQQSGLLGAASLIAHSPPTLTCNNGSSCSVDAGSSASLSWSCTPTSDSSSAGNFTTNGAVSGSVVVTPTTSTTYTLQCLPSGSSVSVPVTVLNPNLSLSITPELVQPGYPITVQWSGQNVRSCTVSGPGINASGLSGSATTTVSGRSVYTLTCKNPTSSISISKEAVLVPTEKEQ